MKEQGNPLPSKKKLIEDEQIPAENPEFYTGGKSEEAIDDVASADEMTAVYNETLQSLRKALEEIEELREELAGKNETIGELGVIVARLREELKEKESKRPKNKERQSFRYSLIMSEAKRMSASQLFDTIKRNLHFCRTFAKEVEFSNVFGQTLFHVKDPKERALIYIQLDELLRLEGPTGEPGAATCCDRHA